MVYNQIFPRVVQQINLMRLFMLSLLLSAVMVFKTNAAPIPTHHPNGDLTNPVITCPGNTVLQVGALSCDAPYNYTVTASDDLPGWTLVQTQGLASGASFPIGVTVNTYLVTDVDGNTADCSFTVTVVDDVPPNVLVNDYTTIFISPFDDPNDCYEGYVTTIDASSFDDGSYDNCGSNVKITVRRAYPFSDFVNTLNPVNGHPDCNDVFPDFPSEFEKAISEYETIKFYCEEAGTTQTLIIRAYQLDANGNIDLNINGTPIFNEALSVVAFIDPSIICAAPNTSARLAGSIQIDADGDCIPDQTPQGLTNMVVEAKTSTGETFYTLTGTEGTYNLSDLPEGLTSVNVQPYLPLWSICNNQTAINLPAAPSATQLDFSALPTLNCPLLTVDIASNDVKNCATNTWPVAYSNKGSITAQNATVQIKAKAPFVLVDANQPFTILGDIMTVQVGDIKPGASGSFEVRIQVPCDMALIGQNLCVEAAISPVSNCLPTSPEWSGAQIEASAVCEGDSIRFTLTNTGSAATSQSLDFVIIDDMVVMHSGTIPAGLPSNGAIQRTVYAQGRSLRIQSSQEPGHPLAQRPSLALDNCDGVTTSSSMLQFPNEDGSPFTDQECRQVVASNNSSTLLAFPVGVSNPHYVEANSRVTYQVNFQNTTTNDVRVVVIQDNIPASLNPADIHMGASSHPYTWGLSGTGVLEIRFEPIDLPAATNNEAASRGFVQFDIAQRKDNPVGTLIENTSKIYFDIDPSFQTNTTFHTVGQKFLATSGILQPSVVQPIEIYPNPAFTQAFLRLDATTPVQVRLLNILGQNVGEWTAMAPGLTLERGKMSAGIYQVEVQVGDSWLKSGKLIWK